VPETLQRAAHEFYLPLVARDLRIANLVATVDAALGGAGVAYAMYKGPAVARRYPRPALRMFGDLDVLVDPRAARAAENALHDAGLSGGWGATPSDYAEASFTFASGHVDLHWHVMREAPVRDAFGIDTAAMLSRAQRVPLYETEALVLDDVDELIAVATHACFDGAYRLGWLVDVARVLRAPSFDVAVLRSRCAANGTSLPVQIVLDRAVRALGITAVRPPLARGGWRRVVAALAAARPVERTFRQAGRGGLVFRATRRGSAQSAAALGRLAVTEALVPLVRDRQHRWRTDPKSRI
jgi:hypothetical protein